MARPRHTNVPTQYLGFSLQVNRLLAHLLEAKEGATVSLEVLGDVATSDTSGGTILEETKSRTSRSNPVADRSIDLWKTLRNWLDVVSAGHVDPDHTRFVMHTSKQFSGTIVESFHNAHDEHAASEALSSAIARFSQTTSSGKKKPIARGLKPHIEQIFAEDVRTHVSKIVRSFSLESGSSLSKEELLALLKSKAIGQRALEPVLTHLLGWVKDQTDELIVSGNPATVRQELFAAELLSIVRKFDRSNILMSFAPSLTEATTQDHLQTRLYVQQLDLIEASLDDRLSAISDFLRAEADRIDWAAQGLVHESTYDEIEDALATSWRSYHTKTRIQFSEKSLVERGQLLYADCCLHTISVQGLEPPEHFCRGCFQTLADNLELGWHPDFAEILGVDN